MFKLAFLVALVTLVGVVHSGVLDTFLPGNNNNNQQGKSSGDGEEGTRWAVLMAGSDGFMNYRHQADVCHAYQLLKRGGLKDENIITLMYDDIAYDPSNPHQGKLFNRPGGPDVYEGILKDYTGDSVTAKNFYAILAGNSSAVDGGNGKVLASGPNDHVFIYYTDHGSPGVLGTPGGGEYIFADKLNAVLRQMHKDKHYKSLVFYVEACESGSIFEGLLGNDLNIYAVTASNATESSWATYCDYDAGCLGDLFSVAWMEDVEAHDRASETLEQDYETVKSSNS